MSVSFPARYSGLCHPCAGDIKWGESIRLHPDVGYVHEECYDDVPHTSIGSESSERSGEMTVQADKVLPRGKTAKDRCNRCFIIHTAAQGDECE